MYILNRFFLGEQSSYRSQHSKEVMASQKNKFVTIWAIRKNFRKEQDKKIPPAKNHRLLLIRGN